MSLDIKENINDKKEEVLELMDKVILHIDWSECGVFHQPGNWNKTFKKWRVSYTRKSYSSHAGYKYSKDDAHEFAQRSCCVFQQKSQNCPRLVEAKIVSP